MAARKSRWYLNSFIPVNKTHDEVVKNIFRPGKFACTLTGCLQLVGIISLFTNLLIVTISKYCVLHPCNRRLNIGTASATILNATVLYFIFCCGYVVNNPSFWVRINIVTNLILSIISIIAQSMAMNSCLTLQFVHNSPGPLAIVGGGCLLLSCFSLFFLYRYKELDVEIIEIKRKRSEDRTAVVAVVAQRNISVTSRSEDDSRKTSAGSIGPTNVYPTHIKAHIYVKHDDVKRKCSRCVPLPIDGTQSPRRKVSVYARNNEGSQAHALHNSHHQCPVVNHIKRKMSSDHEVNLGGGHHEEENPPSSNSKQKMSVYSEC